MSNDNPAVEVRGVDFEHAARVLQVLEKGYSANDNNRGAVNWGITEYFLHLVGEPRHPRDLSWEDAKGLYYKHYWVQWKLDKLDYTRQHMANFLFASLVNTSPQHVALAAQKALGGCGFVMKYDGAIGPITLHSLNHCDQPLFLWNFYNFMLGWYETLAEAPRNIRQGDGTLHTHYPNAAFLSGWTNRLKYLYQYGGLDNPPPFDPGQLSLYNVRDPRKK